MLERTNVPPPASPIAPRAEARPSTSTWHGITLVDEFAWLRAANWQEVMRDPSMLDPAIRAYLDAENAYADAMLADTTDLQAALFATNSGKRLRNAGDLEGAVSQFRSAINAAHDFAPAHYELGLALRQQGKKEEAAKEFTEARTLDPKLAAPDN